MEDTPVRRKRKHKSPKIEWKEERDINLSFIFANFDNFATFVDRAVFTFIKDWSEGFPNMVLSTEYSEAVKARYTFQPLWVSVTTSNSLFSVIHHSRSQVSKTKIYFSFLISTCLLVGFTVIRLFKHLSMKNWEKILSNEGASLQGVWRHAPTKHFEILRLEIWNFLGEQFLSTMLGQLLAICTIIRVKCNLNLVTKVLWQF